jgi:hypothetical protein
VCEIYIDMLRSLRPSGHTARRMIQSPTRDLPGSRLFMQLHKMFTDLRPLCIQGYSFKVVTDLVGADIAPTLQLSSRNERLDLLAKLKSHAEAGEGIEKDADEDGLPHRKGVAIHRRAGTLASMSGADALYHEFPTVRGGAGKPKGANIRKLVSKRRAA